ncbi:hypothetical protein [Nonomuraea sp. NPDC003709]|uniref:hypothetical protein n=1 Tax=Nonomuraea sp. NPDC003709 TaxID=3154450 RepID=UPI0033A819E9
MSVATEEGPHARGDEPVDLFLGKGDGAVERLLVHVGDGQQGEVGGGEVGVVEPQQAALGDLALIMLATGSIAALLFTRRAARLGPAVTRSVLLAAGATAVALPSIAPWPVLVAASTAFAVFAATAAMAWYATRGGAVVPDEHRATAVSLLTLCYQLGGAFGPAPAILLLA